jgi:hypothetical protein
MPVFRVERNKGYTVMSNYHLRDKSLSLKAKGLLSQILSLPEDWDYTLSGLCYINRESKDAIRSAVNELERAGYIERHQTTDEGGKFSSNEYIIHEQPTSLPPLLDKPLSENPTTEKPPSGNPTQLNKDIQDLFINPWNREVRMRDQIVILTHTEYEILYMLASNPGVTFKRKQIYASIWREESDVGATVVTNHMSTLRQKLGLLPSNKEYIETIYKVGYRFVKYK